MAMIALKCPEVQVVVLDINEGVKQGPLQQRALGSTSILQHQLLALTAASGSNFPHPATEAIRRIVHNSKHDPRQLSLLLQTALLHGIVTSCPSMSQA